MSRDTNGTYSAPSNSWNEAVEGTVIDETEWNETLADIEDALTDSLSRSGKGTISKHIDFDENGSPGTPASNVGRLYVGDAGGATTLYFKDAAGNTTNLLLGAAGIAFSFDTSTTTNADPGDGDIRFNHASPASVTEIAIDDLNAAAADISAYINAIAVGSSLYIQKRSDPATFIVGTVLSVSDESGYTEIGFDYVDHNGTFVASDPLGVLVLPPGGEGLPGLDWKGAWQDATGYSLKDGVSNDGSSYICTSGHTSDSTTEPGVGVDWATVWDLLADKGADGAGTGDVVGPASSVTGNLATFADTSGKEVEDSGIAAANVLVDADIGTAVQGYDADTLKADTADVLTAGFAATVYNAGTQSTGTYTPNEANGNLQRAVNGGAHTLAPPTNDCTVIVQYTNNGSAGTITTSGFTTVSGTPTTVNGDDFLAYVTKINGFSHLTWIPLQ